MCRQVVVMMLGGAKRVSMARMISRSLRNRGCDPVLLSYELSEKEPVSTVARVCVGKRWRDPEVDDDIMRCITSAGGDKAMVIPFVDGAIEVAARLARKYPEIYAPTAGEDLSRIFYDKRLSAEEFGRSSLPIPATISPDALKFPLIAKPRLGSASKGIVVARSAEDLRGLDLDDFLLQEYVENATEYTVDCFVGSDGSILCVSPRIRLETAGGEVTRTRTIDDPELVEKSERTLKALGLKGVVTLQFLRGVDGRALLMEINPRLGGGAVCTVHAGADIPALMVDEALGISIPARVWPKPSTEIARYMKEVVFSSDGKQ